MSTTTNENDVQVETVTAEPVVPPAPVSEPVAEPVEPVVVVSDETVTEPLADDTAVEAEPTEAVVTDDDLAVEETEDKGGLSAALNANPVLAVGGVLLVLVVLILLAALLA